MPRRPSIRPVVWQPPPRPPRARGRTGPVPLPPLRLVDVGGLGPEDVVVDGAGRIVTGVADGRLLRIDPDSGRVERIADTGGRAPRPAQPPPGRAPGCGAPRGAVAPAPPGGAGGAAGAGGPPLCPHAPRAAG